MARKVDINYAAAYLGVGKWTVRKWCRDGILPAVKLVADGQDDTKVRYRIDAQILEDFSNGKRFKQEEKASDN